MTLETVPKDLRGLRACLVCSLIKVNYNNTQMSILRLVFCLQTFDQFEYEGCDNCDEFLRMKNNKDNVYDCTSSNFDGCVLIEKKYFLFPHVFDVLEWSRLWVRKIVGCVNGRG